MKVGHQQYADSHRSLDHARATIYVTSSTPVQDSADVSPGVDVVLTKTISLHVKLAVKDVKLLQNQIPDHPHLHHQVHHQQMPAIIRESQDHVVQVSQDTITIPELDNAGDSFGADVRLTETTSKRLRNAKRHVHKDRLPQHEEIRDPLLLEDSNGLLLLVKRQFRPQPMMIRPLQLKDSNGLPPQMMNQKRPLHHQAKKRPQQHQVHKRPSHQKK